ncbi:MJ1255/VC2487 family glycosyltransferase [Methylocaldum gracile subsp. desertum]|uniref:MJ1255/VC2487 family glycosyltransferase n=1 Tax=Methylocaldum sp. GT1BW TaxID=3438964 RepID=UPI003DA0D83D
MKVFYGVQATGNGHITRARAIAPKLKQAGAEVTYLFSGRPWEKLFEMDVFGDYQWRAGLTFETKAGNVRYIKTAVRNNLPSFVRDVKSLDLSQYDIVVSDFEPVTAWAARLQGIKTVGIGHQYAFGYDIPKANADVMGNLVLKYFAPVTVGLGVHWHHFHHPILPPIIETDLEPAAVQPDKIVVYLPFEDINQVVRLLKPFHDRQFHIYSSTMPDERHPRPEHIHIKQLSRKGFQHDFADAAGVICNSGFELTSEALHLGKKLLVKPLHGQMEQNSNALALEVLQLGQVMQTLDGPTVEAWLQQSRATRVVYPDVARAVADWLMQGDLRVDKSWVDNIWSQVHRTDA